SNRDGTNANCSGCAFLGGAAKYSGFAPTSDGVLVVQTAGSTNYTDGAALDTTIQVYEGLTRNVFRGDREDVCKYLIGCDDNSGTGGKSSLLALSVVSGRNYVVEVDTAGGEKGNVVLTWQLYPSPTPFEYVGGDLYLTADSNLVLYGEAKYAWLKNGSLLRETPDSRLLLEASELQIAATYAVAMTVVTTAGDTIQRLTNTLGSILAANIALESNSTLRLALQFQSSESVATNLQVEAASTASSANSTTAWQWTPITPSAISTNGSLLILRFLVDTPGQFYRVRPKSR
ncbi:MAG: hypothetical protein L0Y58_19940, partial [Verrucomicrobia subdivision 3 bacterium]|nr:hypothetical protein [Limisphaerales bacterium]